PLAWAAHALGGFGLLAALTAGLGVAGYLALRHYLAGRADDPAEVVIDEVVGMLITLWPLSFGLTIAGASPDVWPWPGWVIGFLLFRFFDIVKPWPVRLLDRPGAGWVMADDIGAGAISAALVFLAAMVAHG
ncbi:MAG: phosphatidylglycerophosphatase A, partial [Pseudomonadota bacterium]